MGNLKPLSYQEMKDYLHFLNKELVEIVYKKRVYFDVHNALIEQKAKMNPFISWMLTNYYQTLILSLCRILEPKMDDNRKTLKHFINSLNLLDNRLLIENAVNNAKVKVYGDTNVRDWDISEEMKKVYHSINFEDDLNVVGQIHTKIKIIRDKKIAHSTDVNIEEKDKPAFEILHEDIEKIVNIVKRYNKLFRTYYIDYEESHAILYGKFHLFLK